MSLFRADQSLATNSYYAATAPQRSGLSDARGRARLRRRRRRRRAGRAVGGDRTRGPGIRRGAARCAPHRLRRVGPQRRAGACGAGLRTVEIERSSASRPIARGVGHDARSDRADPCALRALRHRLRLAGRLPVARSQRAQGARARAVARAHAARLWLSRRRRSGPAKSAQWIASPRFHSGLHDPLSGHLHPLKYCIGLARAADKLGVRIFENSAVTALARGATADAPHRRRPVCAQDTCCSPATST